MAEGKFVISAQNKIKEGLDGAKKDLLGFEDAANKVGKSITQALTVAAIAQGLKKLGEAAFDCFKEFAESERRLTQLKLALDGNASSFTKATNLIDDMRKMSLSSKDDIEGLVAELAALGKSDAEIEAITTAAVNLSNVTGKDLNSSFTLINATYAGTTGRLTQLIPEVGSLTKEELAAGEATKLINDKFTTLSTTLAQDDISQKLKNIKDAYGDFREALGAATAPIFSPIIDGINQIINRWTDAMRAADNYHKIAAKAGGYADKINLKQQALDFENKRLLEMKGTPNYINNKMSPADKAALSVQEAKVTQLQAEIRDLKRTWQDTPIASLINPSDIVKTTPFRASAGDGAGSGTPKKLSDFSPILTGPLSAAGYALEKAIYEIGQGAVAKIDEGMSPGLSRDNPMSAAGYAFAKSFYDQFEKYAPPLSLSEIYGASGVDMVGGNMGATTGQRTSGTMDVDAYSSAYADAFAGAIDAELMPQSLEPIGELNTNLINYQESLLLNFAPVKTMAEQLSDIYGSSGVDMVGGNSGVSTGGGGAGLSSEMGVSAFQAVLGDITAGMTGAFDTVKQSMTGGDVSKMFSVDMIGPITAIMEALGPFGEMIAGMNPLLAVLVPIIEGFVSVIGPAITEVLAPLFNALTQVGQMLGAALLPILDALMPIFSLLANHILTNFSMVMQVLSPIIEVVALVFQMMTPILTMLSKVFVILMSPVQFIADLFSWLGGVIKTFAWNIAHPFRQEGYEGFSSDAFTGLPARLAAIDAMGANSQSLQASYSQSDATATQSANYRTQPITVNIYQQAPVVGSDGMSEFAKMIRGEIEMLAYAGA